MTKDLCIEYALSSDNTAKILRLAMLAQNDISGSLILSLSLSIYL